MTTFLTVMGSEETQADQPVAPAPTDGVKGQGFWSVADFGARGDGKTDDTSAFQKALDAASHTGGVVLAPAGAYLINGHLSIPNEVALEGVWLAPVRPTWRPPQPPQSRGTTLLAVEGAGNPDGEPFIFLHENATLKGLTIFHPEQVYSDDLSAKVVPYPWTVRGSGQNCSIIDVLMVNPYQAVDFGTFPCGRHLIRGLIGEPLKTGVFIAGCGDVGRVEDVHFWAFGPSSYDRFIASNGTAFLIGQTAWENMVNCFSTQYRIGYHFIREGAGEAGPTANVLLTQCGAESVVTAVLVDDCAEGSGLSFVNGQYTGGVYGPLVGLIAIPGLEEKFDSKTIEIRPTNTGPVKFTNCLFGTTRDGATAVLVEGKGQVTFNSCGFSQWGMGDANRWAGMPMPTTFNPQWGKMGSKAPAIRALDGGLTVMGCDFMEGGKTQIEIGESVVSACIIGNRLRGGEKIINRSKESVQIGLNTDR